MDLDAMLADVRRSTDTFGRLITEQFEPPGDSSPINYHILYDENGKRSFVGPDQEGRDNFHTTIEFTVN